MVASPEATASLAACGLFFAAGCFGSALVEVVCLVTAGGGSRTGVVASPEATASLDACGLFCAAASAISNGGPRRCSVCSGALAGTSAKITAESSLRMTSPPDNTTFARPASILISETRPRLPSTVPGDTRTALSGSSMLRITASSADASNTYHPFRRSFCGGSTAAEGTADSALRSPDVQSPTQGASSATAFV